MPKLKDLSKQQKIILLNNLAKELNLQVASDEEWNTIYTKFEINIDSETENPTICGLSGSEQT